MAETVFGGEVILGLSGSDLADNVLESLVVGEGEEHRFDVGIVYAHMLHAVLFLVASGELVFFDTAFHIVIDVGGHHYAVLRAAVHCLGVDIVVFLLVLHQPAVFAECGEIGHGTVVDLGSVLVGARSEIDLGLDDVVERTGVAFGLCSCFFAVEYIVGPRSHFGDDFTRRTYAAEWFYFGHDSKVCWVV